METRNPDRPSAAPVKEEAPSSAADRRSEARRGDAPVRRAEPVAVSPADRERLAELAAKRPNPDVLPPDVRTEDEEMEFRKLSAAVTEADRAAAAEAARPAVKPTPEQRMQALKAKGALGEGETIELRRIEELLHDEARIEELKGMDKRVVEEDQELVELQARVAEARVNGGFDANG